MKRIVARLLSALGALAGIGITTVGVKVTLGWEYGTWLPAVVLMGLGILLVSLHYVGILFSITFLCPAQKLLHSVTIMERIQLLLLILVVGAASFQAFELAAVGSYKETAARLGTYFYLDCSESLTQANLWADISDARELKSNASILFGVAGAAGLVFVLRVLQFAARAEKLLAPPDRTASIHI